MIKALLFFISLCCFTSTFKINSSCGYYTRLLANYVVKSYLKQNDKDVWAALEDISETIPQLISLCAQDDRQVAQYFPGTCSQSISNAAQVSLRLLKKKSNMFEPSLDLIKAPYHFYSAMSDCPYSPQLSFPSLSGISDCILPIISLFEVESVSYDYEEMTKSQFRNLLSKQKLKLSNILNRCGMSFVDKLLNKYLSIMSPICAETGTDLMLGLAMNEKPEALGKRFSRFGRACQIWQ